MIISFIIPVFNTSSYLDKCLESLFNQGLSNEEFEVITINDGSTDNSLDILEKWKFDHDNIIIISQKNQGLSIARNNGISIAKGDYIQFVDSDDWLNPQMTAKCIRICNQNNLDILAFNMQKVNTIGEVSVHIKNKKIVGQIFSGEYLLTNAIIEAPVWRYLIKKTLVDENNLRFYPNIWHEDEEFTPRLFLVAQKVLFTDDIVYNYFIRSNSITQDLRKREQSLYYKQKALFLLNANLKSKKYLSSQMIALTNKMNQLIVDIYISIALLDNWATHFYLLKKRLNDENIKFKPTKNLNYKGILIWMATKNRVSFCIISKIIMEFRTTNFRNWI